MGCYFSQETIQPDQSFASRTLSRKVEKTLENVDFECSPNTLDPQKIFKKSEILKQYKFVQLLGKGMFSEVFLAKEKNNRKVAIKVIRKRNFTDLDSIKKIITEKEIMNNLNHRNILKLHRTFQTNSRLFFVMEYAENGNLLSLINSKMFFKKEELLIIIAQIIRALFYMHFEDIIYGDLKAENVLFDHEGILKLCDFNLSGTTQLLGDSMQGTTSYMAPEIVINKPKTPKSDFWSLGILIHLMFYRKHAFTGSTQDIILESIVNDELPVEPPNRMASVELRKLIVDLLNKNPAKRIGNSISEFENHPFFRDFQWKDNLEFPIDQFLKKKDQDLSLGSENMLNQTYNNFVYEINDFTFDSSRPNSSNDPQTIKRKK